MPTIVPGRPIHQSIYAGSTKFPGDLASDLVYGRLAWGPYDRPRLVNVWVHTGTERFPEIRRPTLFTPVDLSRMEDKLVHW